MSSYKKSKLLKQHRLEKGFTREELVRGICDTTTLKRYENEGMAPCDDKYRMLQEKMGGTPEQLYISSELGIFVDGERYQKYEDLLSKHDYDELRVKIPILKQSLKSINILEKQQFLGRLEILLETETDEDKVCELEKLLRVSVPEYKDGNFSVTKLYNDTELHIMNDIAIYCSRQEDNQKADRIYTSLNSYIDQAEDNVDSLVVIKILFNYANYLGVNKKYKEAIAICKKAIGQLKKNSCQEMMYAFLFNIGWLYNQMYLELNEDSYKDLAKDYVKISLSLAKYNNESSKNIGRIEKFYKNID